MALTIEQENTTHDTSKNTKLADRIMNTGYNHERKIKLDQIVNSLTIENQLFSKPRSKTTKTTFIRYF